MMMTTTSNFNFLKEKKKKMNILNINDLKTNKNTKCVFVSGVTGQDGSHMVDFLLKNTDYDIIGGARRLSSKNHENIKHLEKESRFKLINFDLTDSHSISKLVERLKPSYFINLAAQSYVGSSWDFPVQTFECNSTGVIHILEAIKLYAPNCRFYNAGSSEEFGDVVYQPQDHKHPYRPRSPYGASKCSARQIVKVYRDSYNLYAIQGLLFNHEGTRRGEEFVTRKITKGVCKIYDNIKNNKPFYPIELGNVYAKRDWSDAEDFVEGIWMMLNQEIYRDDLNSDSYQVSKYDSKLITPLKEYILSSQETHTVKEFVELSFKTLNIEGVWHGERVNEQYSVPNDWVVHNNIASSILVKINPNYYRPAEVDLLYGDSSLIRNELGWNPKTSFEDLVKKMIENDIID
jgi:GDPmannose 4,6-dehydratase